MVFGTLGKQWTVWKAAWQAESGQPANRAVLEGPAAEFLPEALDIQETPPSPLGRALLWTILIGVAIGASGTILVKIDAVTIAHGKVLPSADPTIIYSPEAGALTAIHVHEGQAVKQRDVLIELDPAGTVAERDRAAKEYRAMRAEAARLRALLKNQATLDVPADAEADDLRVQQQLLRDQLTAHQAKLTAARHLVDQRRATVGQTKETLLQAKVALSTETQRAEQAKKLMEQGIGAKTDFLQAESRRIDTLQEVTRRQKQLEQDRTALAEAEQESHTLAWDFQQAKQAELSALETKAASLAQEVAKAEQKPGARQVRSPIDGVVQQLGVHTVGTVVTSAQPVLMVVPPDHSVEVEAQVERKDVGVVRKGQPVEVKVHTIQSAGYRTIPGHVVRGPDENASNRGVGLDTSIRIRPDRSTIQQGGAEVKLAPGMMVTVEIKTGPRPMIEYLLEPLLQSGNERMREWNELVRSVRGFLDRLLPIWLLPIRLMRTNFFTATS